MLHFCCFSDILALAGMKILFLTYLLNNGALMARRFHKNEILYTVLLSGRHVDIKNWVSVFVIWTYTTAFLMNLVIDLPRIILQICEKVHSEEPVRNLIYRMILI